MPEAIRGSCLCQAVRFRIEDPFLGFQYCYCSRCRKESGSAHGAKLFVPASHFHWEQGEQSVRRYDHPEAKYWCTAFCDTCGARMPWLSKTGKAMIVPAGALDKDPGARPSRVIFYGSRAPWCLHASELETHEAYPST